MIPSISDGFLLCFPQNGRNFPDAALSRTTAFVPAFRRTQETVVPHHPEPLIRHMPQEPFHELIATHHQALFPLCAVAVITQTDFILTGIMFLVMSRHRWLFQVRTTGALPCQRQRSPVSLWHSLRYSHLWSVHARRSARLRLWLIHRDKLRPGCPDCIPGCVIPQTGSVAHS